MQRDNPTYLGYGVYAQFDGYHVWVMLNTDPDSIRKIALEPAAFAELVNFAKDKNGYTFLQQIGARS